MPAASYYESNARQRVRGLFDDGTVVEILPPQARVTSPHLAA
ncbi:biotin-independent malonate decarboxylase subunit beta, partial [Verminephrobacter eiseniae]|nr:biotin-independent malonate decarboxylase subunit beta [Verminephrobacter eiseniae]